MNEFKKTLVIGASENPDRYSNKAIRRLLEAGHEVVAIGKIPGTILGTAILTGFPELKDVDTVSLYLNPLNQKSYYHYLIHLRPKRIIFNPGTENLELETICHKNGIETQEACTLVMLSIGAY